VGFSEVVGTVSGLLAVFTFLTGAGSIRELRLLRTAAESPATARRRSRLRWVVWLSAPVFAVSLVVTWTQGQHGSDTGGARFLLLLAGGLLLVLYATVLRHSVSWGAFLVLCVAGLGGLGLLFGSISGGEEAEGVTAGLVLGAIIGLLGLAFRTAVPATRPAVRHSADTPPASADQVRQEKEILELARSRGGEVRVGEVALHTSLSLDEARALLDQLASRHFCERAQQPEGATVYRFPDFVTG
jgi:hypothetical protein